MAISKITAVRLFEQPRINTLPPVASTDLTDSSNLIRRSGGVQTLSNPLDVGNFFIWSKNASHEYNARANGASASASAADNLGAINQAITDADAAGGGIVSLPAGTLDLGGILTLKRRVYLRGGGGTGVTILRATTANPMVRFDTLGNEFNLLLSDLQFNLNNIATYGIDSIDSAGAGKNTWFAQRLRMFNLPVGATGIRTGSWSVTIRDCVISGGGIGIDATSSSHSGSNGLFIDRCTIGGTATAAVRIASDNAAHQTTGVNIKNCVFDVNAVGVLARNGALPPNDILISGNRFESNTLAIQIGVAAESNINQTIIRDNFIVGPTALQDYLIKLHGASGIVTGNTFASCGVAAVRLEFDARNTYIGNNARLGSFAFVSDGNAARKLWQQETQVSGLSSMGRYQTSEADALVAGDFALSAGWGNTASIPAVSGTDQRGAIQITANGSGIGANPTITLTFKNGAWPMIPHIVTQRSGGAQPTAPVIYTHFTSTTTAATFQFIGTPVAGETYVFSWVAMG
jgi:hypothetical protein